MAFDMTASLYEKLIYWLNTGDFVASYGVQGQNGAGEIIKSPSATTWPHLFCDKLLSTEYYN